MGLSPDMDTAKPAVVAVPVGTHPDTDMAKPLVEVVLVVLLPDTLNPATAVVTVGLPSDMSKPAVTWT